MKNKIFFLFLIIFMSFVNTYLIALDTTLITFDTTSNTGYTTESILWKRLKIKVTNDSTILIYAFKADIKEILMEIDKQSPKYKFLYDSAISGISPEISMPKEELLVAVDNILVKNVLYKEKISVPIPSKTIVYKIKKGIPPKIKPISSASLTMKDKLKDRSDKKTFQDTIKLLKSGGKDSIPFLLELLTEDNKQLHEISIYILGEIDDQSSVAELFLLIDKETDYGIKFAITETLIKMKKHYVKIVPEFLNLYSDSKDEITKMLALNGYLKTSNNKEENQIVLNEAIKDSSSLIRMKAAEFLISQGDRTVIKIAEEDINDPNPLVRRLAVEVLGKTGDVRVLPFIKDKMIDPDNIVRAKAHFASEKIQYLNLGKAGEIRIKVNFLQEILVNDAYSEIKNWAGRELLNIGKEGVEALKEISKKDEFGEAATIARKLLN